MRKIFLLTVLLAFLCSLEAFSNERHPIKLRYGENLLSIKIANNTSTLLQTITAETNNNSLPKEITISVHQNSLDINPNEQSTNAIVLKINVSDESQPGSYVVPLILKDSLNNKWSYTLDLELTPALVKDYELEQNYPNPFNGTTIIKYSIPNVNPENVKLIVYDLLGQKIKTLVNEKQETGKYSVIWNGKDDLGRPCSSGIYLYKVSTNTFQNTKKMIFLE